MGLKRYERCNSEKKLSLAQWKDITTVTTKRTLVRNLWHANSIYDFILILSRKSAEFEFGRADDGVFDSPGGGGEMVGHNVAGPDQFGRLVKAESRGWTGEYVD